MLTSIPDRVANRLEGRVPAELLPSVYYPRLVAAALSVVSADARAFLREVGGPARGWAEGWIGGGRGCGDAECARSSVSSAHGSGGAGHDGEVVEGWRRTSAAATCAAVGELLGKLCVAGKARAVAVALLHLALQDLCAGGAGGSVAGGGSGEDGKVRGPEESVVSFLATAATDEKTAVTDAVERVGSSVGCVVGREVLRCVATKALESLLAALINAEAVPCHASSGAAAARGQSKVGRARIAVGGVHVVGAGCVRAELVALVSQIRDRWDVHEVLHTRFLTERTLSERARSRLFSLLLAVDVIERQTLAEPRRLEASWGDTGDSTSQERGLRVAARRLAQVFADESFAKCGGDAQQDHVCGLLVRCLLHLGETSVLVCHCTPALPRCSITGCSLLGSGARHVMCEQTACNRWNAPGHAHAGEAQGSRALHACTHSRRVLCAGKEDLEASSVIPSILQAVQVRLHSPIASARKRAMLLAQVFAFVVDPDNPLQFEDFHSDDEEEVNAGKEAAEVYGPALPGHAVAGEGGAVQSAAGAGKGNALGNTAGARAGDKGGAPLVGAQAAGKQRTRRRKQLAVEDPDQLMVSSESDSDGNGSEEEDGEEEDSADEGQGDGVAALGGLHLNTSGGAGPDGGRGRGQGAASEDETDSDGDEESDDGLVPYEMDDDEEEEDSGRPGEAGPDEDDDGGPLRIGEGRVPLPSTLRQCLSGLRSNSADEVEAAVFALPDLAEQSPDLSGEICCEVALTLLRLEDRIAMDDFVGRRHRGLVALACADPKQVALGFSQAVWYAPFAAILRLPLSWRMGAASCAREPEHAPCLCALLSAHSGCARAADRRACPMLLLTPRVVCRRPRV